MSSAADRYLERLGTLLLPAATYQTPSINFEPRDIMLIEIVTPLVSATFSPIFLFFNDDHGANYSGRELTLNGGSTTPSNDEQANSGGIRVGPSNNAVSSGNVYHVWVVNILANPKLTLHHSHNLVNSVTTAPSVGLAGGTWFNTTSLATSVSFQCAANKTLAANTMFAIFGVSF